MSFILPQAPQNYDASNERQNRGLTERALSDLQQNLQLLRVTQGSLALGETTLALVNGANNNLATGYTTYARVTGPSGAFSITGLEGGEIGRVRILTNTTSQVMTIAHQSASSSEMNRIITDAAADVTIGLNGVVTLVYDATQTRWLVWDRTGSVTNGDKGDITVTGSGNTWTIDNDAVTDAKLRNSVALSVIGRSANSTGDPADIAAASDHQVLRRFGTALAFGAVNLAQSAAVTGDLPFANLAQGSALSVLGVTGNATADNASIVAANDGEVLRRSGTAVAFGTVVTAGIADDAVTYAKIQNVSATDRLLGRSTSGAGDVEEITCTAAGRAILDDADAAAQRVTLGITFTRQAFSASGTWTCPSGCRFIRVTLVGGGGGSGGAQATVAQCAASGGGGGGGGSISLIATSTLSASETVTIGAGGGGGTGSTGSNGSAGGTTSFGSVVSATGGGGGTGMVTGTTFLAALGGAGGVGSGGNVNMVGGAGGLSVRVNGGAALFATGGSSFLGGGGRGRSNNVGDAVGAYGGGAGASSTFNATDRDGTAGANGFVFVEEYY